MRKFAAKSFKRWKFASVDIALLLLLRLGIDLFRKSPKLRGSLAARAHAVVALSAHNRQFKSQGNLVLGRFIARHLEAAWAQEDRKVIRCALLYRLTVAYSRRLGQLEEAAHWANLAIAEAEKLEGATLKYQTAWARNIHAYVLTRQKKSEEARACMQAAFDHVLVSKWVKDPLSRRSAVDGDLALTRSLVAHNLAVAEAVAGNLDGYTERLKTACRLEAKIEGSAKYWAQSLVPQLKQVIRPDLALPAAHQGLEAATRDNNASFRLFFIIQIADLEFRLGRAGVSAGFFLSARELASRLSPIEKYPDLDLPTVSALEESGDLDRAQMILRSKLTDKGKDSSEIVVGSLSRLAVVAARQGDSAAAESWASRATDIAAQKAVLHLLVRTGLELGRASRFLERFDEAGSLLTWALDLIDSRVDSTSVSLVEELMVLTELGRCASLPPELAQRALGLLVDALSSSSAVWWALPDALAFWLPGCVDLTFEPSALEVILKTILAAGELRDDSRKLAQELRTNLADQFEEELPSAALAVPRFRT